MTRFPVALLLLAPLAFAPACADAPGGPSPDASEAGAFTAVEVTTPVALAGEYRFEGGVVPLGRLTVDVVNTQLPGAAALLARLKAGGATCQLVLSNTYRCKKMNGPEAVPDSSLAALGAEGADLFVSFGAPTAPPVLVNDAESLKEWQIFQPGVSNLGAFAGYRYLQLEGGLAKIVVPAAAGAGSLEFVVRGATKLAKHETKNDTESQWRYHQDMAFVVLEP